MWGSSPCGFVPGIVKIWLETREIAIFTLMSQWKFHFTARNHFVKTVNQWTNAVWAKSFDFLTLFLNNFPDFVSLLSESNVFADPPYIYPMRAGMRIAASERQNVDYTDLINQCTVVSGGKVNFRNRKHGTHVFYIKSIEFSGICPDTTIVATIAIVCAFGT